jgi:hypothetical protein
VKKYRIMSGLGPTLEDFRSWQNVSRYAIFAIKRKPLSLTASENAQLSTEISDTIADVGVTYAANISLEEWRRTTCSIPDVNLPRKL